jgi:hypothetical protein
VAEPSRNRPGGQKRGAMQNIDSWQADNSSPTHRRSSRRKKSSHGVHGVRRFLAID